MSATHEGAAMGYPTYEKRETINDLRDRCHNEAIANGFYDPPATFMERIATIHEEASEAGKEYRNGHDPNETYYTTDERGNAKPEGIPSEYADIIIRVLDNCADYGIDIAKAVDEKLEYNATRGHRYGGKRM